MPSELDAALRSAHLPHLRPLLEGHELAVERPSLLSQLKSLGVSNLTERQAVANALGKLRRGVLTVEEPSGPVLRPGDAQLVLSPYNWAITNGIASTANPGAYLRIAWEGECSIEVELEPARTEPHMVLTWSMDARPDQPVRLDGSSSRLVLDAAATEDATHSLLLRVEASVQQLDRWGGGAGAPPGCSLRLRAIRLPPGARPLAPRVRRRRLLAFGCSITEGVCAGFIPGSRAGDLLTNSSTTTWASTVAHALDAELGAVGFGRQGWTVGGNGNVPSFHTPGRPVSHLPAALAYNAHQ